MIDVVQNFVMIALIVVIALYVWEVVKLRRSLAEALAAKAVAEAESIRHAREVGRLKAEAVRLSKERPGSPVAPPAPKRTVRRKKAAA